MSALQSYDPHHLHHHYHNPHHSTPLFPSAQNDENRQDDVTIVDESFNSTVNIIGLIAALLVSVVIIIGVAFVIRTIRKRQSTADESDEESPNQDKVSSVIASDSVIAVHEPTTVAPSMDVVENTDSEAPQQVFTISFTEVPKRPGRLIRLVPKPLRPKPKPVDIEKLKRELGQIYVY